MPLPEPDTDVVRRKVNTYRQIHNSPPVAYHPGQAAIAQAEAERLLASGTSEAVPRTEGTNVLVFSTFEGNVTDVVIKAIDAWYSGFDDYDFSKPGVSTPKTELFTRLVWKSTRRVGAGVALSNSSGTGTPKIAVVLMKFDPPGNVRADLFSTNVLPPGIGNLVLDDYYTKLQSDDRFLSSGGLDVYVDVVREAAVDAAEARVADVEAHLASNFYRRYEVDDGFLSFPLYQTFSNLVRDEYYVREEVDTKIEAVENDTSNDLADFSNYVVGRVDFSSNESVRIEDAVDQVNADLAAQVERHDDLSNVVQEDFYDKQEADALFATITSLSDLGQELETMYYDKVEADALFYTLSEFQGYSNFISDEHYTKLSSDARFTHVDVHAALSNNLSVNYYDRDTTDTKYAGAVYFRGLSNMLVRDYLTEDASLGAFASRSNFETREAFVDANFYDKAASDARFARSNALADLRDAFLDTKDDLAGLSNAYVSRTDDILFDTRGISNDSAGLRLSASARPGASNVRFFANTQEGADLELMRLDADGRLGIGTKTPEANLHVVGEIYATQGYIQASDCNLKSDIRPITGALDKLRNIGGYTFGLRDDNVSSTENVDNVGNSRGRHAGVLAQEVCRVLPEAVVHNKDSYGVAYGDLTALLIEAIKELANIERPPPLSPSPPPPPPCRSWFFSVDYEENRDFPQKIKTFRLPDHIIREKGVITDDNAPYHAILTPHLLKWEETETATNNEYKNDCCCCLAATILEQTASSLTVALCSVSSDGRGRGGWPGRASVAVMISVAAPP
jgi:hypothetical protein